MPSITHVVVLMLENRSYDNVLGWLYGAGNAPPYDQAPLNQATLNGLTGNESNTDSATGQIYDIANAAPSMIDGHGQTYPATTLPMIDPQEPFGDMAQQYLGVPPDTAMPWDGYDGNAPMTGFADNYANAPNVTAPNIGDVMTYLTPAQLPVTAFLANQFGVADAWYASVPTQTFTNRLFAFAAAPQVIVDPSGNYSVVDDADHKIDVLDLSASSEVLESPSLLSQLDSVDGDGDRPRWKIYFHDYSIALMTLPYASKAARASASQKNVSTFDHSDWGDTVPLQLAGRHDRTFVEDVQNGTLPPFSFIEPRYNMGLVNVPFERRPNETLPPNCNHPGAESATLLGLIDKEPPLPDPSNPPIDASGGELLLMTVYNLLRNSKHWDSTLLIVTYDEAGGVYDHAPPPVATTVSVPAVQSPTVGDTAAVGFGFNAFGGRVPAIVISPYVAAGSTVTPDCGVFDHTSIVKTVWNVFDLGQDQSLTARDAAAPSVVTAINFSVTNDAPAFSGTIVASPSAVIIVSSRLHPQTAVLLASAGPGIALTATPDDDWITVEAITGGGFAPDVQGWTIGFDGDKVGDGFTSGQLTLSAPNGEAPALSVGVSLYLSLL